MKAREAMKEALRGLIEKYVGPDDLRAGPFVGPGAAKDNLHRQAYAALKLAEEEDLEAEAAFELRKETRRLEEAELAKLRTSKRARFVADVKARARELRASKMAEVNARARELSAGRD